MPRARTISSALWSQDNSGWKGPQEVFKSNFLLKSGSAMRSDQVFQEVYPVRSCTPWWQWQCHFLDTPSAVNRTQDTCPAEGDLPWLSPLPESCPLRAGTNQSAAGLAQTGKSSVLTHMVHFTWGEFGDLLYKKTFSSPEKILSLPTLYILVFCKTWKVLSILIPLIRLSPEQAEEFLVYKSWQKPKIRTWLLTLLQQTKLWMHLR